MSHEKNHKQLAADLKSIYKAAIETVASDELSAFAEKWDSKYSMISRSWRNNWSRLSPFFAYSEEIRKLIYTTNAIGSLNFTLRKAIKTKASFTNDEACCRNAIFGFTEY